MSAHTQTNDGDLPLIVSRFPTATQSAGPAYGSMESTTWTAFTTQIRHRRQGEKDGPNFVPCTFRLESNGKVRRKAENVVARTAIALDIEAHKTTGEVPPTVAETVAKIRAMGWAAALYSSHSHTAALPRYRIVIPLDSEIGKHLPAVEVVASALGLEGVLDTSKVGPASVFYLPSCEPGKLTGHETAVVEGEPISAAWMTEQAGAILAAREAEQARLNMEALETAAKRREERIARGFDPNSSLIELIRGHLDIRGEMESHGYKAAGKGRYLYPGSETGVAGVYLLNGRDGVERVYSHHSADPLAAGNLPSWCFTKAIDVVDVVLILDYAGDQKRGLAALATRFGIETRPARPEPEPPPDIEDRGYAESLAADAQTRRKGRANGPAGNKPSEQTAEKSKGQPKANSVKQDPVDAVVAELNERYMVVNEDGKAIIYAPAHDQILNRSYYNRMEFADLQKLYLNRTVRNGVDKKGEPVNSQVAPLWLRHRDRRQFIGGVTFDPSGSFSNPEVLNLWQGFAVSPAQGCWDKLKSHILEVICCGKQHLYNYTIGWMARLIQFPAQQGEVAIGTKGRGGHRQRHPCTGFALHSRSTWPCHQSCQTPDRKL